MAIINGKEVDTNASASAYGWVFQVGVNITLRRSRLSGVARATIPDKQSHLVTNYCTMF